MDATGFLIAGGCFPLTAGYVKTGILTSAAILPACAGLVGAFIGFYSGAHTQSGRSTLFHRLVLVMFLVMGLKMSYDSLLAYNLLLS